MIYGERIRLRHVEKADLPTFVEWLNDQEVIENLMMVLPMSTAEEERWFEKLADQPPEEQPLVIEMKTAQGWRMIGNSAFHNL